MSETNMVIQVQNIPPDAQVAEAMQMWLTTGSVTWEYLRAVLGDQEQTVSAFAPPPHVASRPPQAVGHAKEPSVSEDEERLDALEMKAYADRARKAGNRWMKENP